jgi:Na+/H+-dicarboxylate symporter
MGTLEKILKNQWTILAALAIGIIIGIYAPGLAEAINPFGKVYFNLFIMCCSIMLPAIIIASIGKIVMNKRSSTFIIKIFVTLFLTFVAVSVLSIVSSFIVSPITKPDFDVVKSMGKLMVNNSLTQEQKANTKSDILKEFYFIHTIDTDNDQEKKNRVYSIS